MKIDKQFVPKLTSDMVDPTYASTIEGGGSNGGGDYFPNKLVVSSENDLINVANNGKYLILENDITLTANRTLASNIVIVGNGGKLTGAFTITCDNVGFYSNDNNTTIIDNNVILDRSSTFSTKHKLWIEWFGAVRHTETPNFDNYEVFRNALLAAKRNTLYINEGHYFKRPVERDRFQVDPPTNAIMGDDTHVIGMGKTKTRISMLTNDALSGWMAFVVRDCENGSFENIWLEGDLLTTTDTQNEFRSGFDIENNSHGFKILNNRISHFTADSMASYAWDDYGQPSMTFTVGGINTSTGIDEANTGLYRSAILNISSKAKTNGYGMFTAGGYGGYNGMTDYSYKMFWYDASSTFIGSTDWVQTYHDIDIPENATKFRTVIVNSVGSTAPTGMIFRGLYHSKRVLVAHNEIDHCFRNGISNVGAEWKILNNHFHDNGGITAGPGYDIGIEDGYQTLTDIEIGYNVFENSYAGHITLRWCTAIDIHHNIFKGNSKIIGNKADINARETWHVRIHENNFYNVDVRLGRYAELNDNYGENMRITLANSYTKSENNTLFNPSFGREGDSSTSFGESIIKDNTIIVTRPFITNMFTSGLCLINNIVDFRNSVLLGTIGLYPNYSTTDQDGYKDYIDGLRIFNSQGELSYQGISLYPMDMKNSSFNARMFLQGGVRQDFTWKDNFYNDRIEIWLSNTPFSTDGSDPKTWKVIGGKLTTNATYVAATKSAIKVEAFDLNIHIKGLEIDMTNATVIDNVVNLTNNGTLVFEDCVFKTNTATTWNMNNTTMPTAKFKNCEFKNITPTFRVGDTEIGSDIN
jgi:hypothetical protein